jgi:hypothetical protein
MQYITKLKLAAVHQICDVQDKSTEFMIQYMQDTCKVDHDTVMKYLTLQDTEHTKLFKELNGLLNLIIEIDNLN